jgi:ferredoxin-type protein NapH
MSQATQHPGADTLAAKGWWLAYRWLILRRMSQLGFLGLFLIGPWADIWIVRGNLTASMTLDVLPLTDPYVLLQSLAARHIPELTAIVGALIIAAFYLLVGGRVYCSWVCPVNIVTDTAAWLRQRLALTGGARLSSNTRYWLFGATLLVSMATGVIAWELINPVSMLHRGLIFGMSTGWIVILAIFLFDLLVSRRGWCGHLCPVGAFYSVLGKTSVLRVSAARREQCDQCMDCIQVCPEPQVLKMPLFGADKGAGPIILSPNCTNCGRCIDICTRDVFQFDTRFGCQTEQNLQLTKETQR